MSARRQRLNQTVCRSMFTEYSWFGDPAARSSMERSGVRGSTVRGTGRSDGGLVGDIHASGAAQAVRPHEGAPPGTTEPNELEPRSHDVPEPTVVEEDEEYGTQEASPVERSPGGHLCRNVATGAPAAEARDCESGEPKMEQLLARHRQPDIQRNSMPLHIARSGLHLLQRA